MKVTFIRVDGTEEVHEHTVHHCLSWVETQIEAYCLDTVNLRDGRVMLVDDTGMVDGKPVNPKATALYHAICRPGTPYGIHGDVAIVNDSDFGGDE